MNVSPTYPMLVLEKSSFWVASGPSDFETASVPGLKRNSTLDAIDHRGNAWRVVLTPAEPPRLLARIFGTRIPVNVDIESAGKADLQESMNRVCQLVANDPDDLYSQFVECEQLQVLVRESDSFQQLIRVASTLGEASRFAR